MVGRPPSASTEWKEGEESPARVSFQTAVEERPFQGRV
jgi:hypothetical protein